MSSPPIASKPPASGKPPHQKQKQNHDQQQQTKKKQQHSPTSASASKEQAPLASGGGAASQQRAQQRPQSQQKPNKTVVRTPAQKKVPLFLHLIQNEKEGSLMKNVGFSELDARTHHPSVVSLGLRYADGVVKGADARAVAMLNAFSDVVRDFITPPGDSFSRSLTKNLNSQFDFLTRCRPHSISMGNAVAHLKQEIAKLEVRSTDEDARETILETIGDFIRINIEQSANEIAAAGEKLISNGDVVLTFARSSVVERVLLRAQANGKKFKVVVVGARPHQEGAVLLRRLAEAKIKCQYGQLASISYLLQEVTKVFLGAGALLSNGAVMARAGTAMVAMMAKAQRKPVLVFAESYKFSERVHLDSIVSNELGDPEDLMMADSQDGEVASKDPLCDWRDMANLKLLNLTYDVTHCDFVDVVVTELGNVPPSSVPVVLRERRDNQQRDDRRDYDPKD